MIERRISEDLNRKIVEAKARIKNAREKDELSDPDQNSSEEEGLEGSSNYSDSNVDLLSTIGKVVFRAVGAVIFSIMAVVLALFSGVAGSGGGGVGSISMATFVVILSVGWALLPAIRGSKALAIIACAAWIYLSYRISAIQRPHIREQVFGIFVCASLILLVCLAINPPRYIRRSVYLSGLFRKILDKI